MGHDDDHGHGPDWEPLPGTLSVLDCEHLAESVVHWAGHAFGPSASKAYDREIRLLHERLHGELLDLLPSAPDSSVFVFVTVDVRDTSVRCVGDPMFASMPESDPVGVLRYHRHPDGSAGLETGGGYDCNLLAALAGYGGTVSATVHGPRERMALDAPASPAAAAAIWQVFPAGLGRPVADRPSAMTALSEDRSFGSGPAGDGDPAARTALSWHSDSDDDSGGVPERDAGPADRAAALARAITALTAQPELANPVGREASALLSLDRAAQADAEAPGDAAGAVFRLAAAHLRGDVRAEQYFVDEFLPDDPDRADALLSMLATWLCVCWRAQLGEYISFPQAAMPSADWERQREQGLARLRVLADRALGPCP